MKPLLIVKKQGVYGSMQDQGRYGYRAYGIPRSGPMDKVSFQAAHYILNNDKNQTSFEVFIGGFEFEALTGGTYVLTGAQSECCVNGVPVEMWKTFQLAQGDRLTIKNVSCGSIVYLTPKGGFQTAPILASNSCFPLGTIGDSVRKGSILYGHETESSASMPFTRGLYAPFRPTFKDAITVSVFKGPHFDLFTEESQQQLLQHSFQLTGGNRMGYYLKGSVLQLKEKKDILSEATQFGTIQVPQNGEPIVLMADAQTVGGYPIIATIHEEDLHKIAQMRVFNTVKFALSEG
ncbi:biotin-dependent carboxyltransferase family protein [Lysinibacillus parviboronicapiens]|uniref:5-oxoprolinase subunit C family protein n=1 Tax=Lysinibacillus parviboronicapiens TaxID=436516 RepID=UPI000D34947C|nr:biotin-dependent carboxyltransferase family protein [Lysinibacillus parviboronicapiens]